MSRVTATYQKKKKKKERKIWVGFPDQDDNIWDLQEVRDRLGPLHVEITANAVTQK